jgi:hypothetical protein
MGTFLAPVEDHLILPARVSLAAGEEHLGRMAGRSVPAPVPLRMLIDTGANRTTLSPGIVRHLEPEASRDVRLITPSGPVATTLYWVHLDFPGTPLAGFEYVQVARMEMPAALRQFHGLFGRDLLRRWDNLMYEGRRGRYVIRDRPGLLSWLRRWL